MTQGGVEGREVVVLFDVHLMKRGDAEVLRDWVRGGGCLIADEVPSLDEGRQPLGVFETLFGVAGSPATQEGAVKLPGSAASLWGRRSYEAVGATVVHSSADGPLVLESRAGAGRAVLLNFPLKDCYLDALLQAEGAADAILAILRQAVGEGRPGNVTSANPSIEAGLRVTPQGTALLLLINHESRDGTTEVRVPHWPAGGVVRDMVSGERLEGRPRDGLRLRCPWGETRVLGLFPADPAGLRLTGLRGRYAPEAEVEYTLRVGGADIRGNYLLDVTVSGPDGHVYQAFSALTCTQDATCRRRFRLPVNAQPGRWTVRARSLWDGTGAKGGFGVG